MKKVILTTNLPSGYRYAFPSVTISPMSFGKVIEYSEYRPTDPVEQFYFDYCLLKGEDPNIDNLLLCDYEYLVFLLKALTVNENFQVTSQLKCPRCGEEISVQFHVSDIKFDPLDAQLQSGLTVEMGGQYLDVSMPTIQRFMQSFTNYRRFRKITDMRIIKLISLFDKVAVMPQMVEDIVVNATHDDITVLAALENAFLTCVKPLEVTCNNCLREGRDGTLSYELESLIPDLFRQLLRSCPITQNKILPREVRTMQSRESNSVTNP